MKYPKAKEYQLSIPGNRMDLPAQMRGPHQNMVQNLKEIGDTEEQIQKWLENKNTFTYGRQIILQSKQGSDIEDLEYH